MRKRKGKEKRWNSKRKVFKVISSWKELPAIEKREIGRVITKRFPKSKKPETNVETHHRKNKEKKSVPVYVAEYLKSSGAIYFPGICVLSEDHSQNWNMIQSKAAEEEPVGLLNQCEKKLWELWRSTSKNWIANTYQRSQLLRKQKVLLRELD